MADDQIIEPVPLPSDEGVAFGHFLVPRRADGSLWELGRGSMGVTYRAFDTSLRIEVALKVITADRVQESDVRRRFQREARAAARVRHPNIASVLYLGEQGGEFFYAMEFIAGRSVETLLRNDPGPLPVVVAVALAAQAAAALNAAHRREVVHRDLKPANLMLLEGDAVDHEDERTEAAEGRQLKMIDFGLARSFGVERQDDSMVTQNFSGFIGTPGYASPEQCSGDGTLDGRSDLYSLGIILWQMVTGVLPFTGRVVEVLGKHQFQPPPFQFLAQAGVPSALEDVLRGLLAKAPGDRKPQTAGELRAILDGLLHTFVARNSAPIDTVPPLEHEEIARTSDSTTPPSIGATLLSRYRLGDEAGIGDGGRLFLAADNHQAGLRVGLKLLPPQRLAEPAFAAQLETAIERVQQYPHPVLLVQHGGLQRAGGTTFYVREWAEGFSLLELLRARGALRAAEVRAVLGALPAALDHAANANFPLLQVALHKLFIVPAATGEGVYGDWPGLRSLAVEEWPAFFLKLNPLGFPSAGTREDWLPEDGTRLGITVGAQLPLEVSDHTPEPRYVAAFACIIRELLGGRPDSLAPLSALDGEGNAVLRRAQDPNALPAAYPSVTDFAAKFFATIGETFTKQFVGERPIVFVDNSGITLPRKKIFFWSAALGIPLLTVVAWSAWHSPPAGPVPTGMSAESETNLPATPPKVDSTNPPPPTLPTPFAVATARPTPTPVPTQTSSPAPLAIPVAVGITTPMPALVPAQSPASAPRPGPQPARYRGEVSDGGKGPAVPVTVDLDADRSGGSIIYGSRMGDTKVRFSAISKDREMEAVTKEVITKPNRVLWSGEVFHLNFSPDGSEADYTCVYPQSNLHGALKLESLTSP